MIKTMNKELKDLIDYFETTPHDVILKKIKEENEEDFSRLEDKNKKN